MSEKAALKSLVSRTVWILCLLLSSFAMGLTAPFPAPSEAQENAREFGTQITFSHDIYEAVENADVVCIDEPASTGFFEDWQTRIAAYEGFTMTNEVMKHAKPDAIDMHGLPTVRGEEVAEEVPEEPQSVIWDEAENRLHVQTAVVALLIP